MSPSSRPVSKTAAKRRSILISDKRNRQEAAYSEESADSESTEECNWRDQYKSRRQYDDAQQWNARFQELKSFKVKHGHCNVPQSAGKLGRWVGTQRQQYRQLQERKHSKICDERVGKLESIGFQWSFRDSWKEKWESMFEEIKSYKAKHGHCNVRKRAGKLGIWVVTQRTQYRLLQEGKNSNLTDERIQKLESIGFQWYLRVPNEDLWESMFEEVKSFKVKHGHCNVPRRAGKLGIWVNTQRYQYRLLHEGKQSNICDERVGKLESIGFQWSHYRSENKSPVQAAVLAGCAADLEIGSTSSSDDAHHGLAGASSNDHITNVDCQLNDSRDVSYDEPDVVISSIAVTKVDSEFRPFLLGEGYC